jgi:hypothetical protein
MTILVFEVFWRCVIILLKVISDLMLINEIILLVINEAYHNCPLIVFTSATPLFIHDVG